MKKLVIDLDGTLTLGDSNTPYQNVLPNISVINKIKEYKDLGFEIVIYTSRNMKTYNGNLGKINVITLPIIIKWLEKHKVPFDEIFIGKPWCGFEGFYVDDKAIRPKELVELSYDNILKMIN